MSHNLHRWFNLSIYVKVLTNVVSAGVVDAQQLGLGGVSARGNCHCHREEEEDLKYHDSQVVLTFSSFLGSVQKRYGGCLFVGFCIFCLIVLVFSSEFDK